MEEVEGQPASAAAPAAKAGGAEAAQEPHLARTKDFGFLPIPRRCQYDPARPFVFTMLLNAIFGAAATFTVANLYYCQPVLVDMAEFFHITKEESTRALTLVQLGYLTSLLMVAPLADIVLRRGMILLIVFCGGTLSIGMAITSSFAIFQALSYLVGICTVLPQVLNPMAADLAPPHQRAAAMSIVVTGLITGMLFARITAGLFARFTTSFQYVYWMAVGIQYTMFLILWWMLPDYPRKQKNLSYFRILSSMAYYMVSEPILIQAMLIGFLSCGIFVSWWTNLTFLLTDAPFGYNAFQIGLFALCGVVSIVLAPQLGRLVDRLNPWTGTLLGLSLHFSMTVIAMASAKYSLAPVIIVCIFVDVAQQFQQLGNQVRVYSIDPLSRGRLNGCYGASVFAGQLLGSSAGTKVYLASGWRACFGMSVGWAAGCIFFLCLRGPFATGWVGWGRVYSIRKARPAPKVEDIERAVEEKDAEQLTGVRIISDAAVSGGEEAEKEKETAQRL